MDLLLHPCAVGDFPCTRSMGMHEFFLFLPRKQDSSALLQAPIWGQICVPRLPGPLLHMFWGGAEVMGRGCQGLRLGASAVLSFLPPLSFFPSGQVL